MKDKYNEWVVKKTDALLIQRIKDTCNGRNINTTDESYRQRADDNYNG
jgi:hypothetical protein